MVTRGHPPGRALETERQRAARHRGFPSPVQPSAEQGKEVLRRLVGLKDPGNHLEILGGSSQDGLKQRGSQAIAVGTGPDNQ